jgi:amino acid permease
MENESITSAFPRRRPRHERPTALLILFEIISFVVLARFSWQRRGNKLLFWGLIAVTAMIAAMYFLMFRDVPLRPA